jgi:hypothetical protein
LATSVLIVVTTIVIVIVALLRFVAGGAIGSIARMAGTAIAVGAAMIHIELVPTEIWLGPGFYGRVALLALIPVMVAGRVVAILAIRRPLVVETSAAPGRSIMAGAALTCKMVAGTPLSMAGLAISEPGCLVIHPDVQPATFFAGRRRRVAG